MYGVVGRFRYSHWRVLFHWLGPEVFRALTATHDLPVRGVVVHFGASGWHRCTSGVRASALRTKALFSAVRGKMTKQSLPRWAQEGER